MDDDFFSPTASQTERNQSDGDDNNVKAMEDDNSGNCSYDADASNDSIELNSMNLSLNEQQQYHHHQKQQQQHSHQQHSHHHHQQQQPQHEHQVLPTSSQKPPSLSAPTTPAEIKLTTSTSVDVPIEQRDSNESAVRGASLTPFVPISEETVFLDADPVTSSGISTMSSPMSCDSWMNYSSNSSDDLSCISDRMHAQQQKLGGLLNAPSLDDNSSEESSLEFDTVATTAQSTPKIKRNFNNLLSVDTTTSNQSSDGDHHLLFSGGQQPPVFMVGGSSSTSDETSPSKMIIACNNNSVSGSGSSANANNNNNTSSSSDHNGGSGQTKRLRGKNNVVATVSTTTNAVSSSITANKRKALVHRNSSLSGAICDIRMIDFAHTAFVRKNVDSTLSSATNSTAVQHQGPDNGFLRGIESLRRLLNEIVCDEENN